MKRRILTLFIALAMLTALALPGFAAHGMNEYEQAMYDKFCDYVDEFGKGLNERKTGTTDQYKAEARNVLVNKVELDKAACDDLNLAMDEAVEWARGESIDRKTELGAALDHILSMVNPTANKYGMNITVDHDLWGFAQVTVEKDSPYYDGPSSGGSGSGGKSGSGSGKTTDKVSSGSKKTVNQTGFDLTATAVVSVVLVSSLAAGAVLVRKNRLLA